MGRKALTKADKSTRKELERVADGKWAKGHSGNPRGRPPKFGDLASRVRLVVDPDELVEIVLGIAKDKEAPIPMRLAATDLLFNRGWGKPKISIDLDIAADVNIAAELRFETLSSAARDRMRALLEQVQIDAAGEAESRPTEH